MIADVDAASMITLRTALNLVDFTRGRQKFPRKQFKRKPLFKNGFEFSNHFDP
jgi:hypothetical protein